MEKGRGLRTELEAGDGEGDQVSPRSKLPSPLPSLSWRGPPQQPLHPHASGTTSVEMRAPGTLRSTGGLAQLGQGGCEAS